MKLFSFVIVFITIETIHGGGGGGKKKVHIKIHVPEIVKHHHHTKTVFIHIHPKEEKPKVHHHHHKHVPPPMPMHHHPPPHHPPPGHHQVTHKHQQKTNGIQHYQQIYQPQPIVVVPQEALALPYHQLTANHYSVNPASAALTTYNPQNPYATPTFPPAEQTSKFFQAGAGDHGNPSPAPVYESKGPTYQDEPVTDDDDDDEAEDLTEYEEDDDYDDTKRSKLVDSYGYGVTPGLKDFKGDYVRYPPFERSSGKIPKKLEPFERDVDDAFDRKFPGAFGSDNLKVNGQGFRPTERTRFAYYTERPKKYFPYDRYRLNVQKPTEPTHGLTSFDDPSGALDRYRKQFGISQAFAGGFSPSFPLKTPTVPKFAPFRGPSTARPLSDVEQTIAEHEGGFDLYGEVGPFDAEKESGFDSYQKNFDGVDEKDKTKTVAFSSYNDADASERELNDHHSFSSGNEFDIPAYENAIEF